jgi:hypothetical protein
MMGDRLPNTPAPPPSDGLGDGTAVTPITINVDPTTLTQYQAADYRRDLIRAIYHPGTEFDMAGGQYESDLKAYKAQLQRVEAHLATFPEKI